MAAARWIVIAMASLGARSAWADEPAPPREPTGRFEIGAGFDSDLGFIASARVSQDDLFHTGQRLALSAELAASVQRFRIEHEVRDLLGTGLDVKSEVFSERRERYGFTREGHGGTITIARALAAHTRGYVRVGVEHVDIDVDGGALARSVGGQASPPLGEGLITTLRAGLVYDTLDEPVLPRHGTRLEGYAESASAWQGLGGSIEHARPLGPLTFRAHGRADFLRGRDGDAVPLSARLQHDGNADIRGYPLGSIESMLLTPDGAIATGANLEAVGGLELELPVWPRAGLSVAVFADAALRGNIDPAFGPTGVDLYRSVGASIIWRSPIGVLRFDWAIPLDRDDHSPSFSFGLGGAF